MSKSLKFKKSERLHHKNLVQTIFSKGKSVYDFPLRLVWRKLTPEELAGCYRHEVPEGIGKLQMMVTVPKRKRRHAVDRVLLRRRIREAYRLNRLPLKEMAENDPEIGTLQLAFVYIHTENTDYELIERKMLRILGKVAAEIGGRK